MRVPSVLIVTLICSLCAACNPDSMRSTSDAPGSTSAASAQRPRKIEWDTKRETRPVPAFYPTPIGAHSEPATE